MSGGKNVFQPREEEKIVFQPSFPGQVDVYLPDVEVCFRQDPASRAQLAELLGIDLIDPSIGTKLTPSYQGKECLGNGSWIGCECCFPEVESSSAPKKGTS